MSQKCSVVNLANIPLAESSGGTYKVTAMRLMKVTGPASSVAGGNLFSGLDDYFSEVCIINHLGAQTAAMTHGVELVGSTVAAANVATVQALYRIHSTGLVVSDAIDLSAVVHYCIIGGVAA